MACVCSIYTTLEDRRIASRPCRAAAVNVLINWDMCGMAADAEARHRATLGLARPSRRELSSGPALGGITFRPHQVSPASEALFQCKPLHYPRAHSHEAFRTRLHCSAARSFRNLDCSSRPTTPLPIAQQQRITDPDSTTWHSTAPHAADTTVRLLGRRKRGLESRNGLPMP